MIELRQVSKTFSTARGTTEALSRIDLTIARGEFVCLVGPSGCGKTTLLNLIAGLDRADSGHVEAFGVPITGPGPDRGVMFQDAALFPWLSVEQNVEFGLREQGVKRRERRALTRRFLDLVGMARFASAYVHELSGGMRQRVALARALVLEPEVLLMDEPFGALDARSRDALQAQVAALWLDTGKTFVFVTHDMAEAVRLGSRVIVLGARPARVQRSIDLEPLVPRPRSVDQRAVVELAAHLKRGLDDTGETEAAHDASESARADEGTAAGDRGAGGGDPGVGLPR